MSGIKETLLRTINERTNAKGVIGTTTLAVLFPFVVVPTVSTGITFVAHEIVKENDLDVFRIVAISTLGMASILSSFYLEAKALKSEKYCASPSANASYFVTKKAYTSAGVALALGGIEAGVFNPVNWYAIAHGNGQLLTEGILASGFTLTAWLNTVNTAIILKNKAKPAINRIKETTRSVHERVKSHVIFQARRPQKSRENPITHPPAAPEM